MITEIFQSVLDELSVNTNLLSQSEIKLLDQRGIILCEGLLSEEDIISLRKRFVPTIFEYGALSPPIISKAIFIRKL